MEKYFLYEAEKHVDFINLLKDYYKINLVNNPKEAKYVISYGGDGTLLDVFQKYPAHIILPIRNYNRCEKHNNNFNFFNNFNIENKSIIQLNINNKEYFGLAEMVIRNSNVSKAIRFNIKINLEMYAENVIGDGIICATALGSSGYFKSITNTIFNNEGIGIGFINNTQSMSNLIIDKRSIIEIEILRGDCQLCLDHLVFDIKEGEKIKFKYYNDIFANIINYKSVFMCPDCRNKRHSAYVNTIYKCI